MTGLGGEESRTRPWNLMIKIMATYAQGPGPVPVGEDRGIIQRQDVLDAISQLAALVDESYNAGLISEDKASFGMLMLMVIHEHVSPLPDAGPDETHLRADLSEAVTAIRQARP